jgi:membrane protease YdiL (CAAX protease family)
MQHTLQERHGPLLASVAVAPLFALIHLPGFFAAGFINEEPTPLSQFPSVLLTVGFMAVFAIFLRIVSHHVALQRHAAQRPHRRALPQRLQRYPLRVQNP